MSAIQDMRDAAASLPDGSIVKKMLIWAELELGERAERIFELEATLQEENDQYQAVVSALNTAKTGLDAMSAAIHRALWAPEKPARDITSHVNSMMAHGVAPYAKVKKTRSKA